MSSYISQVFAPLCCPKGAMPQNGNCYCTKEQATEHPYACRVVCESLNYTLPPSNGGCQCPSGYAGEFCDQKPCYVYSVPSENVKFYCTDNAFNDLSTRASVELVKDCNDLGNLLRRDQNFTEAYSECPCFNGALKMVQDGEINTIHSCLCPEPFVGDLCHIEPYDSSSADTTDPVTANTFLAIIAFVLLMITILICCVRRHQRRLRQRAECDFHRHRASCQYRTRSSRRLTFLTTYVPLFPIFVVNSQGLTLPGDGSQKSRGKKKDKNTEEEYPLQDIAPKDPGTSNMNKANVRVVCDEWTYDLIKKSKS